MKKILLSLGAAMLAGSAFAATGADAIRTCLQVQAADMVSDPWDSQFWINLTDATFAEGDTWEVSMSVKADKAATIATQVHKDAGEYLYWSAIGSVGFTQEWETYTANGNCTADWAGGHSIAFNLNDLAEANNYYFDDISFKLNGVEMIKNGTCEPDGSTENFLAKYNQGGIEPAQIVTIEEGGEPSEAIVLVETDFTTATGYYFWKSDATNAEIKDGALVITNEAATENFWDVQYMVADNFQLTGGVDYTISVKIKGFSGNLHFNFGTWGANVNGSTNVEEAADWQTVTFVVTAKEDTDGTAHLLLQSGDFVGSYSIASVKITYEDTNSVETIATPNTVRTGVYTINGMRVADRENLLPGLYIIDGKKVLVK